MAGAGELEVARRELREARAQQSAVAEVLKVIGNSASELQPTLEAIVAAVSQLCEADGAIIFRRYGDEWGFAAGAGSGLALTRDHYKLETPPKTVLARCVAERTTIHSRDARRDGLPDPDQALTRLAVPVSRSGEVTVVIVVAREAAGGFSDREVELVETFADQAAIAIENVRLFKETNESLAQQTAVGDVLKAISRSTFDLDLVLRTVIESAARLCRAEIAWLDRFENGRLMVVPDARFGVPVWDDAWVTPDRSMVMGRVVLDRKIVNVADLRADPTLTRSGRALGFGAQSTIGVPLLRDGEPIGAMVLARTRVEPFTERDVELVMTFADQAAIAIENVRLFNETNEALAQQTATAEVLRLISRSAFELLPVLDALIATAARLADAQIGTIFSLEGDSYRAIAFFGDLSPEFLALQQSKLSSAMTGTSIAARTGRSAAPVQILDVLADTDASPTMLEMARAGGYRTVLGVPLLRDGVAIGVLSLRRTEVRAFSDSEIALVNSYADQAVIAMENARLLSEIRSKSGQLESANAELATANRDLATASRHKSEFLANMSHELRTPLNAIIGFSEVLEQRMFGELNERQAEYTHDIATSGRHLLTLVNEILDLAKVEAGRMELEPTAFAPAETIRGALGFVRERAAEHQITLEADLPEDLGTLVADERKIRQVLLNLLSNAVKFTPDGGRVTLRARHRDGELEVAVQDTGIGIGPEDLPLVFEEFQQVGPTTDRSREGTGLGLTLAKRFAELHGGRIWVESDVGAGTTFTFAIALAPATAGE